jgi:hypothetical protein
VAQAYRLHQLASPIHDTAGRLEPVLALQLKSYADADVAPQPQQAITVAVGQLVVVAFFFAMRSCEYTDVEAQRRTTVVRVRDVTFWKENERIELEQADDIRNADAVSITFRKQKNRDDGTTITQHKNLNPDNNDLCPVRAMGEIVRRIREYGKATNDKWKEATINAFRREVGAGLTGITSKTVLQKLRQAVARIGGSRLGYDAGRVGTHSIRSGAAMAMFLAGVPVETIQLIGRWRSRSFMRYLRIQVPDITKNVASKMTLRESFFTITTDEPSGRQTEIGGNQVDARQQQSQIPDEGNARSPQRGNNYY